MNHSQPWLRALTAPSSIALIGASDDPTRVSGRALDFLKRYGYEGKLYPVNNRLDTVQGLPAFRHIDDVPTSPELAIISLGSVGVRETLVSCIARGVKTAIVYASGFAEQDRDGAAIQQEIAEIVKPSQMRVLGPNCLGAVHLATGVTATFASAFDDGDLDPGPLALLTQSGAFASFIYGAGRRAGVRYGFLATTGNEVDLTISELLREVVELPSINSVLLHVEGLRDIERFEEAARRARELRKPIAVIKVGTSQVGALAARAHTNADVGNDLEYDDLFASLGVHRVRSMEELSDAGQAFQSASPVPGRRVCIVSISGGTGVLMADAAIEAGLEVPELPSDVRRRLDAVLPPFASTRNPVDVTGGVFDDLTSFELVLAECMADTTTDLLLVTVGNSAAVEMSLTKSMLRAAEQGGKPMYVAWVGGSGLPAEQLREAGIPTFGDPNRAVRAAALAIRHSAHSRTE